MLRKIDKRYQQGFSFVELLIAMALNIIILSALIAVFVGNLTHYRTAINTNRLNRQLESALMIMSNDIRRAGYWSNASNDIGTGANSNPFMVSSADISVTGGSCILFTYDNNSNGTLPSVSSLVDDERYGFRLSGNAIQTRPPGATFACNAAASAWENMTDTKVISVTNLSFTLNTKSITTGPGTQGITQRSVDISITGQLVSDATVTRTLTQHVRIRNDKIN